MKNQLVGIFVCMLLIATVLPATGTLYEKTMTSTGEIEAIPILEFINIKGKLLNISVVLMNSGTGTAENITWSMEITDGKFLLWNKTLFYPKSKNGFIPSLEPGEEKTIGIQPILGLGNATVTFYYYYIISGINTSRCDIPVEGKQEWQDQGWLFLHGFGGWQPPRAWEPVQDYDYNIPNQVALTYSTPPWGIHQLHNVRCYNYTADKEEFRSLCSFINGTGIVIECGITQPHVPEYWEWQVELVNGQ